MKKLFSNMKQRYSLRDYKFSLVVLVLAISVIGIFMVRSARPEYMTRQILGVRLIPFAETGLCSEVSD